MNALSSLLRLVSPAFFTLVACSGTVVEPPIPSGMTQACKDGTLTFTAGFRPAIAVDFVGIRIESTFPRAATARPAPPADSGTTGGQEAAWEAHFTRDVTGTPCSSASDRAACEKNLADLRVLGDTCQGLPIVPKTLKLDVAAPPSGDVASGAAAVAPQNGNCSTIYLLYTRGDEIGVVNTLEKARALFGTIDSPEEALYLVQLSGESLNCNAEAPAAYKPTSDGYDVQSSAVDGCGHVTTRKTLHVAANGMISLLSYVSLQNTCTAQR